MISVLAACGRPAPERPNVVLIVVDTLRRDHLGCYGYDAETTPAIDRLAARSHRYERAVSQAPWTTPSIGALFTSQYPTTLGIEDDRSVLDEGLTTLAEALQSAGYRTGAVISHNFCSSQWNFDQGFDEFDESQILGHDGTSSHEIARRGMAFVEATRGEPFFLWLHFFDPHWRYMPHAGFGREPRTPYVGAVTPAMPMRELRRMTAELTPADLAELERQYDEEIAYTDHHLGLFLDRLDELGLFEDALILFVADHGEEFKDHGELGHAHSLYREVLEVPLLIHYPGLGPDVVTDPVATVDLFPTILAVAGLALPDGLVGEPLYPPGRRDRPRLLFSETTRRGNLRSVVMGDLKLIKDLDTGGLRLFDLRADPEEQADLVAQRPAETELLHGHLERWIEELAVGSGTGVRIELTPEEMERLEALGYGGGD